MSAEGKGAGAKWSWQRAHTPVHTHCQDEWAWGALMTHCGPLGWGQRPLHSRPRTVGVICAVRSRPAFFLGKHEKPHLSALLGSAVRSAGNVTLLCGSESSFDVYHLCRAGHACPRRLAAGRSHSGASQAAFPLGPGTPAQEGAYTCYGSFNHSPHEWSAPSDPVHLSVPGEESRTCPVSPIH